MRNLKIAVSALALPVLTAVAIAIANWPGQNGQQDPAPQLKGVWYRGPFEHSGSVATLEGWFDPRRLRGDSVPTAFKGHGVNARAVKGHEFGLELSRADKAALIAFLKTL